MDPDGTLPYAQPRPLVATPPPAALTPEQLNAIATGQALYKPIRRAVTYARFDGWTVAVFAILTGICSITSPLTLMLGIGMGIVAWFELREASRLAAGDVRSPKRLAMNQLALAGLLIAYAAVRLFQGTDSAEMETIRSQLGGDPAMMEMVESVGELIPKLVYGTLIVVAVFVQGGTALFYLSRRKAVEAYVRQTPDWVRAMMSR